MKHLIDPMDLSLEELDHILNLARILLIIKKNTVSYAKAKNSLLYFLNQVQELV